MSTAACVPFRGQEVWLLANATVYEAREVSTEFNANAALPWQNLVRSLVFLWIVVRHIRPSLRRLSRKQAKLIAWFETVDRAEWPQEACREMSDLLYNLLVEERNFVKNGSQFFHTLAPPVYRRLQELDRQLDRIQAISLHLDALAVPRKKADGHDECMEFLSLASEPEEYDFSSDPDTKRVASIA